MDQYYKYADGDESIELLQKKERVLIRCQNTDWCLVVTTCR